MAAIKYSRQRESIREYLAGTKAHPTADMVYQNIRLIYPNISLGTVYRNLNFLVEQGEAIKICCGDGIDHFDFDTSDHYHFICKECKNVSDIEMKVNQNLAKQVSASFDGEIEGSITYFHGLCHSCKISTKERSK